MNTHTWSIVWLAPVSRSSTGLSAESMIIGTLLCDASTTAGNRFATAVPEDVITTAGDLHTIHNKDSISLLHIKHRNTISAQQHSYLHRNSIHDAHLSTHCGLSAIQKYSDVNEWWNHVLHLATLLLHIWTSGHYAWFGVAIQKPASWKLWTYSDSGSSILKPYIEEIEWSAQEIKLQLLAQDVQIIEKIEDRESLKDGGIWPGSKTMTESPKSKGTFIYTWNKFCCRLHRHSSC